MGLLYCVNFNIRLLRKGEGDELFSTEGEEALSLKSDTGLLKREPVSVLADPFLFAHKGLLHLFYERQVRHYGKGSIYMRKTADLAHWSEEQEVLSEAWHLSFPFVFEAEGQVWLLPESGDSFKVQLYRATDDSLSSWKPEKTLLSGVKWRDSSLFQHGGVWYLFTTICDENPTALHLFTSDRLQGPYSEHPLSPVCRGKEYGRSGGCVFEIDGQLFRPAQNGLQGYGKQLSILRIDRLSPSEYSETLVKKDIINTELPFYKRGGHHFNLASFRGSAIVSTDARERNYNLLELSRRLLRRR